MDESLRMIEKEITVGVHCGIHGRVAAELAKLARASGVQLELQSPQGIADCSSILDILALGISRGSRTRVCAAGPDADTVLARACLLLSGTGEEE